MEWYWKQPSVPHVAEFVDMVRKRTGRVPTARTWFGIVSVWTCALAAARAKSLDAVAMAKALQGFELPPEIGLMPKAPFYRAGKTSSSPASLSAAPRRAAMNRRPLQGHRRRQRRGSRRHGRGERLQDDVAGMKWRTRVRFREV